MKGVRLRLNAGAIMSLQNLSATAPRFWPDRIGVSKAEGGLRMFS